MKSEGDKLLKKLGKNKRKTIILLQEWIDNNIDIPV